MDLRAGPQVGVITWAGHPWPSEENPAPRYETRIAAHGLLGAHMAEEREERQAEATRRRQSYRDSFVSRELD